MKKLLLGFFIVTAITGQTETRCFFTEVVVTVLITRCLYDILAHHDCGGHCDNHKLCEKIYKLRSRIENLEHRMKYLEQK